MNKTILFLDLKKQYQTIKRDIDSSVKNVIKDVAFSGGKYVEVFESQFAKFLGVKYFVGLNNGTNALHLAMIALGLGPGDEVILPSSTFIATAWGVSYVGARPIFVDCDSKTWEIDPKDVERKISKKTKAIIGVHLYGQPFDILEIKKITKKYNLHLIEDCAQAHGAAYSNKPVGGSGDIGCFSFYPGKNLGAYGEAGGISTNNKKIAERIKLLRDHGSKTKYQHVEIGFNMRMEGLQGAILSAKLKYLSKWNKRRQEIAAIYNKQIKNPKIISQKAVENAEGVYHLYVITTKDREKLKKYLEKDNIMTALHYPIPCHLQKAYSFLKYKKGDLPNSEYLADHCLSLPIYPEMTNKEVEKIVKVINKY